MLDQGGFAQDNAQEEFKFPNPIWVVPFMKIAAALWGSTWTFWSCGEFGF